MLFESHTNTRIVTDLMHNWNGHCVRFFFWWLLFHFDVDSPFLFREKETFPCLFIWFHFELFSFVHVINKYRISDSMQCKLAFVFVENTEFYPFVNDNYFSVDKNHPLCDCVGTMQLFARHLVKLHFVSEFNRNGWWLWNN